MSVEVVRTKRHGIEVWLVWIFQPGQALIERSFLSETKALAVKGLLEAEARRKGISID